MIAILEEADLGQLAEELKELLAKDLPQQTFPLLKGDDMCPVEYQRLITRLESESNNQMVKFGYLFTDFFKSLRDQEKKVKTIIVDLEAFGAFTRIYEKENPSFLRDDLENLDRATADMEDIQSIVNKYCSFFSYQLLSFLVSRHGTQEDKEKLKEYDKDFIQYAQRRVPECPSEISDLKETNAKIIVKTDDSYRGCSLKQLRLLEAKLCEIFGVTHLMLRQIKEGCLQLTFQLPFFIQEEVFPLSLDQEEKLVSLHISKVVSGDYHFLNKVSAFQQLKLLPWWY